jgi:hypothetical protein
LLIESIMAAPQGNKNATKNKVWSEALRKYITQNPTSLEKAAEALLAKAHDGDVAAIKELGDRLEGKAHQSVDVSGDLNVGFHEVLAKARERARG